jgi:hypothetical protein
VAAITTAVSAQQGPTFRAQVELIQVDAFVTDGAGNPVTNLRVEDFELFEDGKRRRRSCASAPDSVTPLITPFTGRPHRDSPGEPTGARDRGTAWLRQSDRSRRDPTALDGAGRGVYASLA